MAKIPGPLAWVMLARRAAKHQQSERANAFASAVGQSLATNTLKQFGGMSVKFIWDARELTRGRNSGRQAVHDIA